MYLLPVLKAQLAPCPKHWGELLPQPGGRYCVSCKELVHDFSAATNLPAMLVAARAAAPSGRVCGRFAAAQVARLSVRLRCFVVALVLVMGLGLSAQEALAQVRYMRQMSRPPKKQEPEFMGVVVEQMPVYQGGSAGLQQFLKQHLRYPKGATKTGRVFVNFTVDARGKAQDFEIVKGLEPLLDAEVLRVMHLLGDFSPARQNTKPVAVRFTLPVTFSLK